MQIDKILNNNVVIVRDENKNENFVMGKGIAFKKKVGDDIPLEHIELGEEIVSLAMKKLGKELNEMVHITLIDHIYTTIIRFLNGNQLKNVLLWDIKRFYPEEYAIGLSALDLIEERFHIRLPEDEAGFIALHIVNAQTDSESMQDMYQVTRMMQEIINIVKYSFQVTFDEESTAFYRFVTHLKFFAMRIINKNCYMDEEDNELYEVVKRKYKGSYICVQSIGKFIKQKYEYELSKEEELYLMIHIERVINKSLK